MYCIGRNYSSLPHFKINLNIFKRFSIGKLAVYNKNLVYSPYYKYELQINIDHTIHFSYRLMVGTLCVYSILKCL